MSIKSLEDMKLTMLETVAETLSFNNNLKKEFAKALSYTMNFLISK
jgi:hypothetical protein